MSSVTLQQTHPQPYLSAGLSVVAQLTPTYEYFKHIIRNRPSCHGVITVRTGRAAAHSVRAVKKGKSAGQVRGR